MTLLTFPAFPITMRTVDLAENISTSRCLITFP